MRERGRLTRQAGRSGVKAARQDGRCVGSSLGGIPSDRIFSDIRTRPQSRRLGRPRGHRLDSFAWSTAGRHHDGTDLGSMPVNGLRCG